MRRSMDTGASLLSYQHSLLASFFDMNPPLLQKLLKSRQPPTGGPWTRQSAVARPAWQPKRGESFQKDAWKMWSLNQYVHRVFEQGQINIDNRGIWYRILTYRWLSEYIPIIHSYHSDIQNRSIPHNIHQTHPSHPTS